MSVGFHECPTRRPFLLCQQGVGQIVCTGNLFHIYYVHTVAKQIIQENREHPITPKTDHLRLGNETSLAQQSQL